MARPETTYARGDGPAIAYQVVGEGSRDLFYVAQPYTPIDLLWDDPLLARGLHRLASVGRLITCDLRGWGSSDAVDPADLPAMQAWTDDLGRVLDAAGSERAVLIGMAEQALPCMLFAATHPDRVDALVLWAAFASYLRRPDYPWGMPPEAAGRYAELYGALNGTGELASLLAPSRANEPGFREWLARCERLGLRPANCASVYEQVFQPTDLRTVVRTIARPTLVLGRRDDRHVRAGHGSFLAEAIPNSRLVELDGDDHVWWAGDSDSPIEEIVAFVTGLRARATPNRQLATVLFTDIVDSTRQAAALGDARWFARLERHDDLARRFVAAFRGQVVKSTGDGILATFDGPARAITCATDLRDALAEEGIAIRAGMHTGEIEITADDVRGVAVHVAARVAALAEAGEVLVSSVVPSLVLGSQISFDARGSHELKGVPGTWDLLAVSGTRL